MCRIYTGVGGRGVEKGSRVEEWNYQRFGDNKLQGVLMRFIFMFTSCKEISTK